MVPNCIGKSQVTADKLAVGDHAAGYDIGDAQYGQLLILGMKAGFHGSCQVPVIVNVHRYIVALFQQGLNIDVVPLELGNKADDPVQINDPTHSQADADQPVGAGRYFPDHFVNCHIDLLVHVGKRLFLNEQGPAADNIVVQVREDETDTARPDINGNAVTRLGSQGKDDGGPSSAGITHGGFLHQLQAHPFLYNGGNSGLIKPRLLGNTGAGNLLFV